VKLSCIGRARVSLDLGTTAQLPPACLCRWLHLLAQPHAAHDIMQPDCPLSLCWLSLALPHVAYDLLDNPTHAAFTHAELVASCSLHDLMILGDCTDLPC
jgi:hypothetical protein